MKSLSAHSADFKATIYVFVGIIISFIFLGSSTDLGVLRYLFALLVLITFCYIAHRRHRFTYNVFFDEKYFILKNKEEVRKIEISNVKCVEDTFGKIVIMGFHYKKYRVSFINEFQNEEEVEFSVSTMNDDFWEFKNRIDGKI